MQYADVITGYGDVAPQGIQAILGGIGGGAIMAFILAYIVFILLASIVVLGIPFWKLGKRFNITHPWMAWVPVLQGVALVKIAGKPWWWFFYFFAVIVPGIGGLAVLALMVYLWMEVAKKTGHPTWLGILMIVPLANIVMMYYVAFAKAGDPALPTSTSSN